MTNKKTKDIVTLGILTALYVVLGSFVKIPVIGNISLDLGYIAFVVALCMYGCDGTLVGTWGCALESILFSSYGFSLGWFAANAVIGIGCGIAFQKTEKIWIRILSIIVFVAIGMIGIKTLIECRLYDIPISIKLPKSVTAFIFDSIVMIIGLFIYRFLPKTLNK